VAHPGVVVGVVSLPPHQELHPTLPIVPQRHLVPRVRSIHSGVRTSGISVLSRSTVAAPRERHAERCTQAEGQTGRQWCVFRGVCPSAYIVSYRRLMCQPDTRTHTRTLAHTHTHTLADMHIRTQAHRQRYRGAEGQRGAAGQRVHHRIASSAHGVYMPLSAPAAPHHSCPHHRPPPSTHCPPPPLYICGRPTVTQPLRGKSPPSRPSQ
jgi:hypothetical protein